MADLRTYHSPARARREVEDKIAENKRKRSESAAGRREGHATSGKANADKVAHIQAVAHQKVQGLMRSIDKLKRENEALKS